MAFAFGSSTVGSGLGEMALLSNQEMLKTEGEWLGFAARMGRSTWRGARNVWRNTNIDEYNGSRVFQVRWRQRPVFRLDYKANPSPSKLHMHFGDMKKLRPWNTPWRKY